MTQPEAGSAFGGLLSIVPRRGASLGSATVGSGLWFGEFMTSAPPGEERTVVKWIAGGTGTMLVQPVARTGVEVYKVRAGVTVAGMARALLHARDACVRGSQRCSVACGSRACSCGACEP
jgi:hypothetical protein